MIAHGARDEHGVAGTCGAPRDRAIRDLFADARDRDVDAVPVAALDHLGVARHDGDARLFAGFRHGGDDGVEVLEGKALFKNEAGGEIEGPRTAHGDVVDGACDGEPPDVAAREEEGTHDVAVAGDGDGTGHGREKRAVVAFVQPDVREVPSEDVVNELRGGAAARTVGEVDGAVLHVEGAHVKVGHGSSFFFYR